MKKEKNFLSESDQNNIEGFNTKMLLVQNKLKLFYSFINGMNMMKDDEAFVDLLKEISYMKIRELEDMSKNFSNIVYSLKEVKKLKIK